MPKYVVSNTLDSADAWRNSTLISGDVVEQVRRTERAAGEEHRYRWQQRSHPHAGAAWTDRRVLPARLPVVLGGGKKVFPEGDRINLKLVDAKPLGSGVVLTHYEVEKTE